MKDESSFYLIAKEFSVKSEKTLDGRILLPHQVVARWPMVEIIKYQHFLKLYYDAKSPKTASKSGVGKHKFQWRKN